MIYSAKFHDLVEDERRLLEEAAGVMIRAYNPVSHYEVGAALRTVGGDVFLGTFAENSSLGLTICAEAAAILAANTAGKREFVTIVVVGAPGGTDGTVAVTPCGRCRQMLADFAVIGGSPIRVICSNRTFSDVLIASSDDLLPFAFGARYLYPNRLD